MPAPDQTPADYPRADFTPRTAEQVIAASCRAGDILACSGTGWQSRVIRWGTCSRFAHVAIVAEHQSHLHVFESTTLSPAPCVISRKRVSGVQAQRLETWLRLRTDRVYCLRLAADRRLRPRESWQLTQDLRRYLGRRYSILSALGSGPHCLDALVSRHLAGSEGRERAFCSALVVRVLQNANRWDLATRSSLWNPGELVRSAVWWGMYEPPERIQ